MFTTFRDAGTSRSLSPASPKIPRRRFRGALKKSPVPGSSLLAASCLHFPAQEAPSALPLSPAFTRKGRWIPGGENGRVEEEAGVAAGSRAPAAPQQVGEARRGPPVPYPPPLTPIPYHLRRRLEPAQAGAATCPLRALSFGGEGAVGKGMRQEERRAPSLASPLLTSLLLLLLLLPAQPRPAPPRLPRSPPSLAPRPGWLLRGSFARGVPALFPALTVSPLVCLSVCPLGGDKSYCHRPRRLKQLSLLPTAGKAPLFPSSSIKKKKPAFLKNWKEQKNYIRLFF